MTIPPLKYYLSAEANHQADDLIIWLYGLSPDAALRFRQTIRQEIAAICQRVAEQIAA